MANNRVFGSVALASVTLLVAACASRSVPKYAADPPLLEKKFQQAAKHYQKYLHEGQTVYCRKEKVITSAVPVMHCLTEPQLRMQVESFQRTRNPVQRAVTPGTGQGGIGG